MYLPPALPNIYNSHLAKHHTERKQEHIVENARTSYRRTVRCPRRKDRANEYPEEGSSRDDVATPRRAPLIVDPRGPRDHTNRSLFFLRLLPRRRTRANFTRLFRDTRISGRPQQPSIGCVEETRLINEDGRHLSAPAAAVVLGRFVDPCRRRVEGGKRAGVGDDGSDRSCVRRKESADTGRGDEELPVVPSRG